MTVVASNTQRWRVIRYAVLGAILLNIVTLVWALLGASALTTVIAAVALAFVGAAIGGSVGWATAPNRWGRWWAEGRTDRGSVRGIR
jgi:sulfite exporter TauE/SafE